VFLAAPKKGLWGSGAVLSGDGRAFLDTLAAFANRVPDRLVIAENGPGNDSDMGLRRALSVVDYLISRGVSRDRCNIGAQGMLPDEEFAQGRMLEIVLLDESVYR